MSVDNDLKTSILMQFGAALEMLEEAINLCPDALWTAVLWEDSEDVRYGHYWFIVYHTLFWLDLYLTGKSEGFKPPAPFVRGQLPENPYTKADLRTYLTHCRQQCQSVITTLSTEQAQQICTFDWVELSFLELQLYTIRHIQEHSSQLRFFLGRNGIATNDWVTRANILK